MNLPRQALFVAAAAAASAAAARAHTHAVMRQSIFDCGEWGRGGVIIPCARARSQTPTWRVKKKKKSVAHLLSSSPLLPAPR